ncbi:MAG TPA: hypothetical protein VH417_04885 [Vicinamibacterales bacterium]|jgi:hypothetical protein
MADERDADVTSAENGAAAKKPTKEGPGQDPVGVFGITAMSIYLIAWAVVSFYALVVLWPTPTPARTEAAPAGQTAAAVAGGTAAGGATDGRTPAEVPAAAGVPARESPADSSVRRTAAVPALPAGRPNPPTVCEERQPCWVELFLWEGYLWDEQRLLLLVLLSGALGALIHGLRSLYWYVGERQLIRSWAAKYAMQPFTGAALALVFYLVVRGGFFSPQSSFQNTSPFGFAAFAAMIGMFSEQAVLKLRDIATILLTKAETGSNSAPAKTPVPPAAGVAENTTGSTGTTTGNGTTTP